MLSKKRARRTNINGISYREWLSPFCLNLTPRKDNDILQIRRLDLDVNTVDELTRLHTYLKSQYSKGPRGCNVYDLIALHVSNDRVWQQVLTQDEIADVLCLDMYAQRIPLTLKRTHVKLAGR